MAEQLMRRECAAAGRPEVSIHSAGVHARAGRPADSRAIEVAPEFGVSLESHRAAELSPEVIADADLIVVMDYLNEAELLSRYPSVAPKLALMGEFLAGEGARRDLELPDPYMQDVAAIRACFARIQQGVLRLANGQGAR